MLKAVLFDYDDTLVRTKESKFAALQAVARRHYDLQLSDETIRRHWGIAYVELFRALFGEVEADVARAIGYYEAVNDEFPITPHPEALDTLAQLGASALIGIVTSAGRSIVAPQLAQLGLDSRQLTVLQTAEDTPFHKPDPRVFAPALKTLAARGVSPHQILYVGDSLRDLEAARGAGLDFCGVLRGTTTEQEFQATGARYFESLRSLVELIRN